MAHQSPLRPKPLVPTKFPASPPHNRRLHRSQSLEESPLPTSFPAEAGSEPEVLDAEEQLRRDGYPSDGDEPEDPVDEKFFRSDRWKKYVAKNKLEHIQPQAPGQRGTRPAIQVKPLIAAAQQAGTSRQGVSRVSEAHGGYVRLPTAQDDETASVNDEELLRRWPTWKEGMAEAKEQLSLGLPVAANYLLTSLMQFISVAFVGHLGTLPLAASAVAYSLAEITGFSLMEGLASAMETICGQAAGAEDLETVGLVTQKVHLILTVICVPVALLWLKAEPILIAFGQDPTVAKMAAQFLQWEIPGLFATAAFTPLCAFMEVHGVTIPLAIISALSLLFLVLSNYVAIHVAGLGFIGAAISSSLTEIFTLILALAYLLHHNRTSGLLTASWQGWSWADAFDDWGMYLWDAVPSASMICLEWWFFEILILFSAQLPDPQTDVSAMTIGLETITLCYMLPLAFSVSTSVRVSLGLGADEPGAARHSYLVALCLSALLSLLLVVLLVVGRPFIVWVFAGSSAPEVTPVLLSVLPWLVLAMPGICIPTVLSGVLRGSGQQAAGSLINAVSYYAVALPLSYLLTIWPGTLRIHGLWVGMLVGDGIQAAVSAYLVTTTDWKAQAVLAEERVEAYAE